MINTFTSGKLIIARIEHNFKIDNSDWIAKCPLWIADAMAELDVQQTLEDVYVDKEIVAYQCTLPLNIKLLQAITINDVLITPHRAFNLNQVVDAINVGDQYRYHILNGTYVTFGIETGTARFYYKVPAVETIDEYNIVMPKIIDNIFVIKAIEWYVIKQLLYNGYKHPIFGLDNKNPFTNPALAWEDALKKARNNVNTLDNRERRIISELTREFIANYNYEFTEDFNLNSTSTITSSIPFTLHFANFAAFPVIGNPGTLYIDDAEGDTYIWLGLTYQLQ